MSFSAVIALTLLLSATAQGALDRRTPVVQAVERAKPSVVNIGTERIVQPKYDDIALNERSSLLEHLLAQAMREQWPAQPRKTRSLGSGVVVEESGYILTNFHVIERASLIHVLLDDETLYEGTFVAGDPVNDLALIKVSAGKPLPAIPFAVDDDLLLGETVIALGNPFGLAQTVTVGVLSAKNREFRFNDRVLYKDVLQTDAAINFGSSGGPLVNINGDLIGVNVSVNEQAQNIGFAVPVRRVRAFLGRSLSPVLLRKSWLGFDLDPAASGVRVGRVGPETGAAKWGVRPGDEIVLLAGQQVPDAYSFNRSLIKLSEGQRVRLHLKRAGVEREIELPFEPMPKPSGRELALKRMGLELSTEPQALPIHPLYRSGLPVAQVEPDSPAARAGFRPGLLLTRINDYEIRTLDDVGLALEATQPGERLLLGALTVTENGPYLFHQHATVAVTAR
jgi:serine protease Do